MRATVLEDPAFVRQAGRFVWLDVNTERAESASYASDDNWKSSRAPSSSSPVAGTGPS